MCGEFAVTRKAFSDKCFAPAAPSAPPQQVTVLTVGNQNSTSISISWDPPPTDHQNGIIQEYKVLKASGNTEYGVCILGKCSLFLATCV